MTKPNQSRHAPVERDIEDLITAVRQRLFNICDAEKWFEQNRSLFLRLPIPGVRCSLSGLSRSSLNKLILGADPVVASFVLRLGDGRKGIRYILAPSLMEYLCRNAVAQLGEEVTKWLPPPAGIESSTIGGDYK